MKKQYLTILIALLLALKGFAQSEPCLTDELMRNAIKENPSLQNYLDEMDRTINQTQNLSSKLASTPMITIPVIVYIVHRGGIENISNAQVLSQITALNTYFNPYGIRFCLATRQGTSALTNNIIRVQNFDLSDHNAQTEQQALANLAGSFPSNRYLKIWIVKNISNSQSASPTLGYSMFPGASLFFDGIVVRYDAFGDVGNCASCPLLSGYNKGKTLVHEIGHYLSLYHTFHDGCEGMDNTTCDSKGDRVCDTPPTKNSNFSCSPMDTCFESNNIPDDIHNYMDYGDDNCSDHFTSGQIQRMKAVLTNYRNTLISTDNLIYTGVCGYQNLLSASYTASSYAPCQGTSINFTPITTGTDITYSWNFGDPASGANNTSSSQAPSHIFTSANNSPFTVTLTITRGNESTFYSSQIYVTNCSPIHNAQSTWYFSTSNSLNFSSGTPVSTNAVPATNGFGEACSIQNDSNGNVLFYTNGIDLWDSTHNKINPNNPLAPTQVISSNRGVITIPNPSNSSQYYILIKDAMAGLNGFTYRIVNTSGTTVTLASQNLPITFPSGYQTGTNGAVIGGEAIAASTSCNGYWIATTLKKNTGNNLVIYSLTSGGLNYVSDIDLPSDINYPINYIKFSPNGNRLALIDIAYILIYDFNKFTGQLTNIAKIPNSGYSCAFSPDSNLLYVNFSSSQIRQYNLNSTDINSSIRKVGDIYRQIGDMQLGPDNKIYINTFNGGHKTMSVIHIPNNIATESNPNACLFTNNGPVVEKDLLFALPNMIDAKMETSFNNTISHSANGCLTYKFNANVCAATFSWNFGDSASGANNTSTLANPSHTFSSAGTYTVTLISGGNTITKTITVGMATATILGSTSACSTNSNATNNFVILEDGQRAQWSITSGAGAINGLNNQSNVLINWTSLPGTISVTVTDVNGCSSTATKTIIANCNPTTSCDNDLVLNTTETANTTHQVSNTITLNGNYTVNSGVTVNLKAGNTIIFKPNSTIKSGSVTLAKIEDCPAQKTTTEDLRITPETSFSDIRLYPNPTTSRLTIETSGAPIAEIAISSFEGKSILIHKLKESTQLYQIDMSDLQNGIYFLAIKSNTGELIVKKVIKQ